MEVCVSPKVQQVVEPGSGEEMNHAGKAVEESGSGLDGVERRA